jgi:type I restriction enzyme, S subunit
MVPEGWKNVPLLDVCELVNGRGFKPHEWGTVGYPIIRIQNLNGSDEFNYFQGEFNPKILVRDGELLFAWSGSRGTSFGPHIWRGPDAVLNYHTWRVVPKDTTSREFLVQYLRYVTAEIEATAHGASALVHTQKDTMERRRCILPPLPEQQKIAEILGTWDKAIETTEAMLANARTQKRALMQSLLTGTRRFPGFEDHPWREVRLGDVVRLSKDRLDPTRPHNARRCIELEHIEGETGRLIGETASDQQASIKAVFEPGDILFGKLRPYLRKFLAPDFSGVCSTEIWVLKTVGSKLTSEFLHLIVQGDGFMEEASRSSGSKMPRADWGVVADYRMMLPVVEEQKQIAVVLQDADREVDHLTGQLDHLRTEKKSLMQQLLTGKRRVVV